jgi:hypothetical protein
VPYFEGERTVSEPPDSIMGCGCSVAELNTSRQCRYAAMRTACAHERAGVFLLLAMLR